MYPPADPAAVEEFGTVKWYNAMKERVADQHPCEQCRHIVTGNLEGL